MWAGNKFKLSTEYMGWSGKLPPIKAEEEKQLSQDPSLVTSLEETRRQIVLGKRFVLF